VLLGTVTRSYSCIFFRWPLPATNRENHEGRGEGNKEVFTPHVGVSFLGPQQKTFLSKSPGKGKGEVFTLGLPYP